MIALQPFGSVAVGLISISRWSQWCRLRQVGADKRVAEVPSDTAGSEVQEANRRAAHPHMNNLVYGRRSDPAVANEELSGAVCRQLINRCARWQDQRVSAVNDGWFNGLHQTNTTWLKTLSSIWLIERHLLKY